MEPIRSEYEDDPDMLDIVQEFAAELPERAAALEACLGGGDLATLQTLAHQLKGAGGGYGFPQITGAAAQLESALKAGAQATELKKDLDALCEVLRAVRVTEAR
ncbi:MAG: Hpt domain-containing protein [Myxococcota bacterium]